MANSSLAHIDAVQLTHIDSRNYFETRNVLVANQRLLARSIYR